MCPSLAEIRSVTSEIKRRKKDKEERKNKTTAIKYKPSGIAMPCGPQESASQTASRLVQPFFAEYVRVTNRQHALNYVQFPHRQWHIFRKGEGTASKLTSCLTHSQTHICLLNVKQTKFTADNLSQLFSAGVSPCPDYIHLWIWHGIDTLCYFWFFAANLQPARSLGVSSCRTSRTCDHVTFCTIETSSSVFIVTVSKLNMNVIT